MFFTERERERYLNSFALELIYILVAAKKVDR